MPNPKIKPALTDNVAQGPSSGKCDFGVQTQKLAGNKHHQRRTWGQKLGGLDGHAWEFQERRLLEPVHISQPRWPMPPNVNCARLGQSNCLLKRCPHLLEFVQNAAINVINNFSRLPHKLRLSSLPGNGPWNWLGKAPSNKFPIVPCPVRNKIGARLGWGRKCVFGMWKLIWCDRPDRPNFLGRGWSGKEFFLKICTRASYLENLPVNYQPADSLKMNWTFWGVRTTLDSTPNKDRELSPQQKTSLSAVIAKLWLHAAKILRTLLTILKLLARDSLRELDLILPIKSFGSKLLEVRVFLQCWHLENGVGDSFCPLDALGLVEKGNVLGEGAVLDQRVPQLPLASPSPRVQVSFACQSHRVVPSTRDFCDLFPRPSSTPFHKLFSFPELSQFASNKQIRQLLLTTNRCGNLTNFGETRSSTSLPISPNSDE